MPGVGRGGGGGGILNLGGSIDFTIWTPPKVKNKPSRTRAYSTLIECLSSARGSFQRTSLRENEGDARNETEELAEEEEDDDEVEEKGKGGEGKKEGASRTAARQGRRQ